MCVCARAHACVHACVCVCVCAHVCVCIGQCSNLGNWPPFSSGCSDIWGHKQHTHVVCCDHNIVTSCRDCFWMVVLKAMLKPQRIPFYAWGVCHVIYLITWQRNIFIFVPFRFMLQMVYYICIPRNVFTCVLCVVGWFTEWCADSEGGWGPWHLCHQQTDSKQTDLAVLSYKVRLETHTTPDFTLWWFWVKKQTATFYSHTSHHLRVFVRHLYKCLYKSHICLQLSVFVPLQWGSPLLLLLHTELFTLQQSAAEQGCFKLTLTGLWETISRVKGSALKKNFWDRLIHIVFLFLQWAKALQLDRWTLGVHSWWHKPPSAAF